MELQGIAQGQPTWTVATVTTSVDYLLMVNAKSVTVAQVQKSHKVNELTQ